jgi:hypothetical protein
VVILAQIKLGPLVRLDSHLRKHPCWPHCLLAMAVAKIMSQKEPDWESRFDGQEVWIMNTEYNLFNDEGPIVSAYATYKGQFDEICKCLASPPFGAVVRAFYADGVITVNSREFNKWMRYIGRAATSEQDVAYLIWFNLEAAWRGEKRALTWEEATASLDSHGFGDIDSWKPGPQPVPGVLVSRHVPVLGMANPLQQTVQAAKDYLQEFIRSVPSMPASTVIGALLDLEGAQLRFASSHPLPSTKPNFVLPRACVTVLGVPKRIPEDLKKMLHGVFADLGSPMLEISLGQYEEMTHTCVSFLRVQDNGGFYKAALADLLNLGQKRYAEFIASLEAHHHSQPYGIAEGRKLARFPVKKRPASTQKRMAATKKRTAAI